MDTVNQVQENYHTWGRLYHLRKGLIQRNIMIQKPGTTIASTRMSATRKPYHVMM